MTSSTAPPSGTQDSPPDDAALVAAAQREAWAFEALYRRYVQRIYRYVRSRTASDVDAEDLTASTFVEAMTGLDRYQERGHFAAWLFTIARRQVFAHRRRHRETQELSPDLSAASRDADTQQALLAALDRLSEDKRDALSLRYFGDLPIRHIAEILGKSESATKMAIHRGLKELKAELTDSPPDSHG